MGEVVTAPEQRSPECLAKFVASKIERWSGPIRANSTIMDWRAQPISAFTTESKIAWRCTKVDLGYNQVVDHCK
jgi:hypothetical protein